MHVELVTISGKQYDAPAREVRVTSISGAMVVLPHHEPLTAILVPAPVVIIDMNGDEEVFAGFGGVLDVRKRSVHILLEEAEYADNLIEKEIEDALLAARTLKEAAKSQKDILEAQKDIDRQSLRLDVARLRRKPKSRP